MLHEGLSTTNNPITSPVLDLGRDLQYLYRREFGVTRLLASQIAAHDIDEANANIPTGMQTIFVPFTMRVIISVRRMSMDRIN